MSQLGLFDSIHKEQVERSFAEFRDEDDLLKVRVHDVTVWASEDAVLTKALRQLTPYQREHVTLRHMSRRDTSNGKCDWLVTFERSDK